MERLEVLIDFLKGMGVKEEDADAMRSLFKTIYIMGYNDCYTNLQLDSEYAKLCEDDRR